MKYYTFKRESNDFSDILSDPSIKNTIRTKISWLNHLMVGFTENKESDNIFGYIVLKYGDYMINPFDKDYTPKPNIDYIPKR